MTKLRPSSRAHVSLLTSRVELLEGLLRQKGQSLPQTASYEQGNDFDAMNLELDYYSGTSQGDPDSSNSPQPEDWTTVEAPQEYHMNHASQLQPVVANPFPSENVTGPSMSQCQQSKRLLQCITSRHGHWSSGDSSHQVRYYGPTTDLHAYSDLLQADHKTDTWEQRRRATRTISDLATDTYDYLMELFWTRHNSLMHVVCRKTFQRMRDEASSHDYFTFLHICMLAIGVRYADMSRSDIQRLSLGNRGSTMLREARYLFEHDVDQPACLTKVQALLLLGDLECSLGNNNSGWMYTGQSCH
jgi:hypothetical protein